MITDYFILAFRNLKKRKLRSFLTVLGIFVSIAAIFMLISLSLGLQNAVREQFRQLGTDKIFVQPATGFLGPPGSVGGVILTKKDINVIKKVNGVKSVIYMSIGNARLKFNDKTRYFMVAGLSMKEQGIDELITEAFSLEPAQGRFIEDEDKTIIAIGSLYNEKNLFGKEIKIGDKIEINNEKFKVVGVLESVGNSGDDQNVYMTYEAFEELFKTGGRIDQIIVQIEENADVKEVSDKIEKELRKARGVTEKTQDFMLLTPEELLSSFDVILNIVTAFLAGIAGISLLVGAIGISNTMYTSVLERTREIGVMKAIGAKNSDIMWIFLIEAGFLGIVGALIGVGFGYGVSRLIEYIALTQLNTNLLQAASPWYLVLGCLFFGFVIGAVSGTLPAIRASKTNIVDALRYE
ncbi:MAG: ABC transporter permease [Nanoarchaeota archaeon]